jgi:hypothetical protein
LAGEVSECENKCENKLGYKEDALYLWGAFNENVVEAEEMFEARYEKLLGSYT